MNGVHGHSKEFRVAIVGGGICGLVAAIGLNNSGIRVDIFECAAKYGEVGAGVGLGPNAVRALAALGILDEITSRADQKLSRRAFDFKSGVNDCEYIFSYPNGEDDYGLGIHRASFLDALAAVLDTTLTTTHFNKRCVSVENCSTRPIIYFEDGSTHETDLVLGADGIKSAVRTAVVGRKQAEESLSFSNTVAYRGLVPTERLKSLGVKTNMVAKPICWVGEGKHIITFPIKEDTVINIVVFVTDYSIPVGSKHLPPSEPWVTRVSPDEIRSEFENWGDDPRILVNYLTEPSKWSIHSVKPELKTYVNGRVALMGDAAHGMLPHLGAGAGQAIEDALLLSRLLGHNLASRVNLHSILLAYDRIRVPRATMVQVRSQQAGNAYEGHGASGPGFTKEGLMKDVIGQWDDIWHHDLDEDAEKAVEWLKEADAFRVWKS